MPFIDTGKLSLKEPLPGWQGRFFHSEHMTFSYYDITPGSRIHPHHHPNEEVWNVVEGELEMIVDGTTRVVRAGEAAVVPAEVEHAVEAVSPCRVIVVDHPARDFVGGVDIR
jgi:quercetin dioxygenase-like cupin family protein